MMETLTEAEVEELAALERAVFSMRLPMLLLAGFGVLGLCLMLLVAAVGAGLMSVFVLFLPLLFAGIPVGLMLASGSVAMSGRIDPSSLAQATRFQTVFWWMVLTQSIAALLLISVVVAMAIYAF